MKNKLKALYLSLQAIFYAIVPIVVLWLQYGEREELTNAYKLGMSGIIVGIFVFLVIRKIALKPEMDKWATKIVNLETTSYSISNEEAITKARNEWKLLSLLNLGVSIIIPALIFVLSLLVIKAVEEQLIRLYGVLCVVGLSLICGVITKTIEICTSHFKCENLKKETDK